MDVHTPERRSYNMSRIRGRDTKPEILIRKFLWGNGFRYRLHQKALPGKPDIVLTKYRAVIFVHGCFWHRHGCHLTATPASNTSHWSRRFEENVARDKNQIEQLKDAGWRVAIIWECVLKGKTVVPKKVADRLIAWLLSGSRFLVVE